jgi:hypothetical protein
MDFDSIPPGVDFREQIKQTIERANLVIAVIGPDWLGERSGSRRIDDPADFVRLEIAYALNRGIPVIPVLVDDAPMPKADRLPPDIEALAFRNALPLDSGIDFHSHTDRLIVGIRGALSGAPPRGQTNVPVQWEPAASWPDRRRTIAIWSGSILVSALAIFALWRFIASGSAERTERERTIKNDNALAATATPYFGPSTSPPPITPAPAPIETPILRETPASESSITPRPTESAASAVSPTAVPLKASPTQSPSNILVGTWEGDVFMLNYPTARRRSFIYTLRLVINPQGEVARSIIKDNAGNTQSGRFQKWNKSGPRALSLPAGDTTFSITGSEDGKTATYKEDYKKNATNPGENRGTFHKKD